MVSNIFFLIASAFFLQYTTQAKQTRGTPEVDYPTYFVIPSTSFRCSDQLYNPGFYADTETRCQVFHYCYDHRQESFLCPMGTIFNQPILACDYWYSSNCSLAPSFYQVNAEKRKEEPFDQADYPQESHSENLFDKMSNLYEINKTPDSPVTKNEYNIPESELSKKEGYGSFSQPFIENIKNAEDYNEYNYDKKFNLVDEKHPEVNYEVKGLNSLNADEADGDEKLDQDFVLSMDGMLHPSQDIYHMNPPDMNFNQGFIEYAEIPSPENSDYDLSDDFGQDYVQMSDFELYKRYSDRNGGYVGRPSRRKPVIIPESEPEIVQLPALKPKRKPIKVTPNTNTGSESYSVFDEPNVSVAPEDFEDKSPGELPFYEQSLNLNDYQPFGDSNLLYENQENVATESDTQSYEMDSSTITYDFSDEKTRNAYVFQNIDYNEISADSFGSGSDVILNIPNVKDKNNIFTYSDFGDESTGILTENTEASLVEDITAFPDETAYRIENGSGFDIDPALDSSIDQPHSMDGSGFAEDESIFSDTEMTDTDLSAASEGSGIPAQEIASMHDSEEKVDVPNQFGLNYDSEGNIEYGRESGFSLETSGNSSASESLGNNEEAEVITDGSGESSEFTYFLPSEFKESFENPHEVSEKTLPEIKEIDGTYYYVSPNSEYHPNYEYDDLGGVSPENIEIADNALLADSSDKTYEETRDIDHISQYFPADEQTVIDIGGIEQILDYQESKHSRDAYENISDDLQTEVSSDIPEVHIVGESDKADTSKELSREDLKFLEIMSQATVPIVKNLFEVSSEKSTSDAIKDEISPIENITKDQDGDNDATFEESPSPKETFEIESILDMEHSTVQESSKIPSGNELNRTEAISNTEGSGQDRLAVSSEKNTEFLVTSEEKYPLRPDKELLQNTKIKQTLSLNPSSVIPQSSVVLPVVGKDLKKVARGKRLNENLRTFNPQNKDTLTVPRGDTFREALFMNIPSEFLKMKHSTLRPNFYNLELKNSGFFPRKGDQFKPSKLNSFGKRLMAAKRSTFNFMKKYIDSYRN